MFINSVKQIDRITEDNVGTAVRISLKDGNSILIDSMTLRKHCPCASCLEKRGDTSHHNPLQNPHKPNNQGRLLLKVISATHEEETNLNKIWLIGNYALGMKWGDGHDSGIYTFDFLTELADLNK